MRMSKLQQLLLPKIRVISISQLARERTPWHEPQDGTEWYVVTYTQPHTGSETGGRIRAKDELDAYVKFAAKAREKGYLVERSHESES